MRLPYPSQLMQIPSYIRRQPSPTIATMSTPPRSTCPTPLASPALGGASNGQQDTIDPQTLKNMHEFLRSVRRGGSPRRASSWQGFVDSDDDMESIRL